jgi:WD40 repeat protein
VKTGSLLAAFIEHEEAVTGVAWREDDKQVFSAGRDKKVRAWNAGDGKSAGQIGGFNPGEPLRVEEGMGFLFVCSSDGKVRQYSAEKRELVRTLEGAGDWAHCLAIDEKNRRVAAGYHNGELRVWSAEDGKVVASFLAAPGLERK